MLPPRSDETLTDTIVTEPTRPPGKTPRRIWGARAVEGAAIGIAGWCVLFAVRLLPGFLADTTGIWLFMLIGAVLGALRLRALLIGAIVLGAASVLLVTQTRLANAVASRWVRADSLRDSTFAAIVVTSAGVNTNSTINGEGLDHLLSGLELVRAGRSKVLVSTTVQEKFPSGMVSSTLDQSRIVALFPGEFTWLRTATGESTRDEAVNAAALLLPKGMVRIALVAAPMHTRRACSAFEAVGFLVTCIPARSRGPGGGWVPGPWPEDRLAVFGDWIYEVAATAKYKARGWLHSAG